jgi:predicted nucleic acid-binding protein
MAQDDAGVLVDSHLWVEFLSRKKNRHTAEVERLIRAGRAVLAGPVLFEVLVGPRQEAERQYLLGRMRAFRLLQTTDQVWLKAVTLGRLEGVARRQVPFSNVLIASHAEVHQVRLFSLDSHFDVFPHVLRHRA